MLIALLLAVVAAPFQTPVKNPTSVTITCPDHNQDTGHEIDIVSAGIVVQTIQGGDPAPNTDGSVTFTMNVQPIKFGSYTTVVRATSGTIKSDNSPASDAWDRSPGAPGKPIVK